MRCPWCYDHDVTIFFADHVVFEHGVMPLLCACGQPVRTRCQFDTHWRHCSEMQSMIATAELMDIVFPTDQYWKDYLETVKCESST